MGVRSGEADVEHAALAGAAGLFALVAPWAAALALAGAGIVLLARARFDALASTDRAALPALVIIALCGALLGWQGAVGAALVWRGWAEVARAPETLGLAEPPWLAIVYRWSPVAAALLFRLEAPAPLIAVVGAVARLTIADWALRRLAEWRLGEPQPYDTKGYMLAQARVLAIIVLFPEPTAALAAFAALALARHAERRPAAAYAAAL